MGCHPAYLSKRTQHRLEMLRAYARKHGHTNVSFQTERPLGLWVLEMRTRYKNAQLSPELFKALSCIPKWTWDIPTSRSGRPQ
ncbi:MAG TPA: helicase associated domain-containing protein [Alphaproteobacteria bacterium]|nr:helicase associated domain-containing protein [Alphaproteobacteria bacterium]